MLETTLLAIRKISAQYVVHPTSVLALDASKAAKEKEIWYYQSTKPVTDFAQAGVFSTYDSLDAATEAILAVDSSAANIYNPSQPPID